MKKREKKNCIFSESYPDPLCTETDPRIRIKLKRIHNTGLNRQKISCPLEGGGGCCYYLTLTCNKICFSSFNYVRRFSMGRRKK